MLHPLITFVIATYKRVDALQCTLQSLILQSYPHWEALVIGDCCGDETTDMICLLNESRIKYYNLPVRFGEQSGPNSFGLHLARGEFVTFLNHDDLLLSDHLDYALQRIKTSHADFYIGLSAHAVDTICKDNVNVAPVFISIEPKYQYRRLDYLIKPSHYLFDPSSFWLANTAYAKEVGYWKKSNMLWRTPLRDWIMRAWRLGGKFAFSDRVTGIRFLYHYPSSEGFTYNHATSGHSYMIKLFHSLTPVMIRTFIDGQIRKFEQRNINFNSYPRQSRKLISRIMRFLIWKTLTTLYLKLGLDYYNYWSWTRKRSKGGIQKLLTQERTGEEINQIPDISTLFNNPEEFRVI